VNVSYTSPIDCSGPPRIAAAAGARRVAGPGVETPGGRAFDVGLLGPSQDGDVVGVDARLRSGVEDPLGPAADRDHAHAGPRLQVDVAERPAGVLGAVLDCPPDEHLDGFRDRRAHRVRQPHLLDDDLGDVARSVADLLCAADHTEHRRQLLGIAGVSRRHHQAHPGAHLEHVHLLFEG
jgi:hypothetical protein